jgi:hypothetical protein
VEHCLHGKQTIVQKTLDWKPMPYATQAFGMPLGGQLPHTTTFEDQGEQTHVPVVFGQPEHEKPLVQSILRFMLRFMGSSLKKELTQSVEAYFALAKAAGNPQTQLYLVGHAHPTI